MEQQPAAASPPTGTPPSARSIFDHALEIASPEQRRAYLVQACDGDPALRQKVDALLEAHEAAGSFLESRVYDLGPDATLGQPAALPPHEGSGSVVGPYKLL